MQYALPQRTSEHQLEEISIDFFKRNLPSAWTRDKPNSDYGIDLRVGIAVNTSVTAREFIVQVKSSSEAPPGDTVELRLEVSTLNYLRDHLSVALVVKYVDTEKEAYWLLLKDFTKVPRLGQKTVTVRIPRANRISADPWSHIAQHVERVHFKKLRANC